MASVSLSLGGYNNGGQCWVSISGLGMAWNTTNYDSAGITTSSFTNGQSSYPSGTVSSTSPSSSGSSTSFGWTATGLGYGSKTYYAWVKTAGGNYWSAGSSSIYIPEPPPPEPNPPYNISSSVNGQDCTISFTKGANAYGTRIYYWGASVPPENGIWLDTTGTSFYLTGLGNNVTYYYNLQSYSSGYSSWSSYTSDYSFTTETGRPSNFYFITSYVVGGNAEIDANDWHYIKNKINEFRTYKGISTYTYTYSPWRGDDLAAVDFTQVRTALWGLSGYMTGSYSGGIYVPASQYTGNSVYALFFNNIQNSLNSVY